MSEVKLVLFDVGNVVIRSTHAITYAILLELGVRPDKAALFFHNPAYGQFARGKVTGEQFAEAVWLALEVPCLTKAQTHAAHDAHVYMVDKTVVAVLTELKEREVPLAFVTTTNVWQTEREKQLIDLAGQFGPVVRSHDIGMTKTDDGAWLVILAKFGVDLKDASRVLFVDDAPANIKAAERAKLRTHLYDPTPVVGVRELREALREYGLIE